MNSFVKKPFAYLVQGQADKVETFEKLQKSNSDLYVLTYDRPHLGAGASIYDDQVSWAEGRNILLQRAEENSYEYYVFLDDDAEITMGSFEEFERLLLRYRPEVGIPLTDVIEDSFRFCPRLSVQIPVALDQIVQAFSAQAVKARQVLPYVTRFDEKSWWYSCEINTYQILRKLSGVAQFNGVRFQNTNHAWSSEELPEYSKYRGGTSKEGMLEVRNWLQSTNPDEKSGGMSEFMWQRAVAESQKTCFHHLPGLLKNLRWQLWNVGLVHGLKYLARHTIAFVTALGYRARFGIRKTQICRQY